MILLSNIFSDILIITVQEAVYFQETKSRTSYVLQKHNQYLWWETEEHIVYKLKKHTYQREEWSLA